MFAGDGADARRILLDGGLYVSANRSAKDRLTEFLNLFKRWDADATMIGRTFAEPRFRILDGGHTLVDLDLESLQRLHQAALKPIAE